MKKLFYLVILAAVPLMHQNCSNFNTEGSIDDSAEIKQIFLTEFDSQSLKSLNDSSELMSIHSRLTPTNSELDFELQFVSNALNNGLDLIVDGVGVSSVNLSAAHDSIKPLAFSKISGSKVELYILLFDNQQNKIDGFKVKEDNLLLERIWSLDLHTPLNNNSLSDVEIRDGNLKLENSILYQFTTEEAFLMECSSDDCSDNSIDETTPPQAAPNPDDITAPESTPRQPAQTVILNSSDLQSVTQNNKPSNQTPICHKNEVRRGNACVGKTKPCKVKNGRGTRTWNVKQKKWRACVLASCHKNFHAHKEACRSNKRSCNVKRGTGEQVWSASKKRWGSCKVKKCNQHSFKKGNSCALHTERLKANKGKTGIRPVTSKKLKSSDFNKLETYDFNNDRKKDKVVCGSDFRILSSNGKTLFRRVFKNEKHSKRKSWRRVVSSCDVINSSNQRPAVLTSLFWTDKRKEKHPSRQFIIHWNSKSRKYVSSPVKVGSSFYTPVGRGVTCRQYQHKTINKNLKKNFRPGHLCFYTGYRWKDPKHSKARTKTALLKVERSGNGYRFIDISRHLTWSGGIKGSPYPGATTLCSKSNPRDRRAEGLNMMDSAFIRTENNKGLDSIITVGQHTHVREHRMYLDKNAPQGINFENRVIYKATCGTKSEFLRIKSFDERSRKVPHKCVYITGEMEFTPTHDFLLCQDGKSRRWVERQMPFKLNSEGAEVGIRYIDKKLFIRAQPTVRGKRQPIYFHIMYDGIFRNNRG